MEAWQTSSEYRCIVQDEWQVAVEALHNRPSIVAWGLFNEFGPKGSWKHHRGIGGGFMRRYPPRKREEIIRSHCDFVKGVVHEVRRRDKQKRPIHDSSGWIHVETDLWSFHEYEQRPDRLEKILLNLPLCHIDGHVGQPLLASEYGGVGLDVGGPFGSCNPKEFLAGYAGARGPILPRCPEEALERITSLTAKIVGASKIVGFCYTQLYDIEYEKNGLLRYDRKRKFPLLSLKRIFNGRTRTKRQKKSMISSNVM